MRVWVAWAAVLGAVVGAPAVGAESLELIPRLVSVAQCDGVFTLDAHTAIRYADGARALAEGLHPELEDLTGLTLALEPAGPGTGRAIFLGLDGADPVAGSEPKSWSLPCVTIRDAPRFAWRGLMLDCSRAFQSLAYLRKTIDRYHDDPVLRPTEE